MKNLSELQGELYKLSAALDALSRQVEDLKPKEDSGAPDYAVLEELAQQSPIKNSALAGFGEEKQERYLRLLSTAALLEEKGMVDKLLYVCRVAAGSNCPRPAQELQKMAYETDRLDWQSAAGSLKALARPLLLDMLMVSNLGGPAGDRALEFISSVAELLECKEEDVTVTAQLAAALLAQDEEAFQQISVTRAYPELGYLVPEKWLKNSRGKSVRYREIETVQVKVRKTFSHFVVYLKGLNATTLDADADADANIYAKPLVNSGVPVAQGMPLVKFKREFNNKSDAERYTFSEPDPAPITANRNGIVFFRDESDGYRHIYIMSPFDSKALVSPA